MAVTATIWKKETVPRKEEAKATATKKTPAEPNKPAKSKAKKLTYKLEHELKQLPSKIKKAEQAIVELSSKLSDSDFYTSDPDGFHETTKALSEQQSKLERYETDG